MSVLQMPSETSLPPEGGLFVLTNNDRRAFFTGLAAAAGIFGGSATIMGLAIYGAWCLVQHFLR